MKKAYIVEKSEAEALSELEKLIKAGVVKSHGEIEKKITGTTRTSRQPIYSYIIECEEF